MRLYCDNKKIVTVTYDGSKWWTHTYRQFTKKKLENGSICDNSRAISRCSHKRLVETSVPSSSKQIGYDKHLWTDLQDSMKSQFS